MNWEIINANKKICTSLDTRGRTGLWDWVQDFYDCGTCDIVWDIYQLGVGRDLLDNNDALILSEFGEVR